MHLVTDWYFGWSNFDKSSPESFEKQNTDKGFQYVFSLKFVLRKSNLFCKRNVGPPHDIL